MGILNVTPDSFAERVATLDPAAAVDAALRMEADGADIIDIGGESTRPGADAVSAADELARVLPGDSRRWRRGLRDPDLGRHLQGRASRARPSTPAPAIVNDVSGLRVRSGAGARGRRRGRGAGPDAHARAIRGRCTRRRSTATSCAEVDARAAREHRRSPRRAGVAARSHHRRSRDRVCQTSGAQLWCAGAVAGAGGGAGAPAARRTVAQVVYERGARRPARPRARLGNRRRRHGSCARGAHIVRVHAVAEMVQVVRVAEEIRRHG